MQPIRMVLVLPLALLIHIDVYAADVDTKFIEAARKGDTTTTVALLAEGADVNAQDGFGRNALMWASFWGDIGTVEALIGAGADVDAKGKFGLTAIMDAASRGHTGVVKALIGAGADVGARDELGNTFFTSAFQPGRPVRESPCSAAKTWQLSSRLSPDKLAKITFIGENLIVESVFLSSYNLQTKSPGAVEPPGL
jgi:ankyrin repeat protein